MIDLEFVERLIRAIDESGLDSVEIERGGTRIRIAKTPPQPPQAAQPAGGAAVQPTPGAPAAGAGVAGAGAAGAGAGAAAEAEGAAEPDDGLVEVTSPMVGTFYRAPAPDAPPYVEAGDRIAVGDTLCIIEAMKLMNELESEVSGTIVDVLVENAEPVEYGQVLFRVRPAG